MSALYFTPNIENVVAKMRRDPEGKPGVVKKFYQVPLGPQFSGKETKQYWVWSSTTIPEDLRVALNLGEPVIRIPKPVLQLVK